MTKSAEVYQKPSQCKILRGYTRIIIRPWIEVSTAEKDARPLQEWI